MAEVRAGSGRSVLIVEDEYIFQSELERAFRRAGFGVVGPFRVADALKSLSLFRDGGHPDAIILGIGCAAADLPVLAPALQSLSVPLLLFSPLGIARPPAGLEGLRHWSTMRGYDGLVAEIQRQIGSSPV